MIQVALAGNPNTGKSSLFNALTGSYEYVGNWTGVTVEKKVGLLKNKKGNLIDLPGVYSLNPLSKDEGVTSRFLLNEKFTTILNVIDASQLERNLNLSIQLLEFGKPLLIGLNMIDVMEKRGLRIDTQRLSTLLKVPVYPIVARTEKGCDEILRMLGEGIGSENRPDDFYVDYGAALNKAIQEFEAQMPEHSPATRWMAVQFFEGNSIIAEELAGHFTKEELQNIYQSAEQAVRESDGANKISQFIRKKRNELIQSIIGQCVSETNEAGNFLSERIDRIVLNKYLGIPIFLLFMYLTFKLTFEWAGSPLSDLLDAFFSGPFKKGLQSLLQAAGASDFIQAVLLDGVVSGVGGVLVFVPQIFLLFFIISFIEDSGYMARVATVMDRLMEGIGLNGKAFIPMIIGFGCNVPGVMAARSIEQPKERLLTIILTPLMSCSARLSVYSLFVGAFFIANQALIVLSLYLLGVIVALTLAKLFSSTFLKQEQSVFVIELPPYRIPHWKTLWRSTWEKGKGFVKKAGTFIFGGSVVIWLLGYVGPGGFNVPMDKSFLAIIGGVLAPVMAPLGFGSWQAGAALLTGFLAKEVVVSTMNIIYTAPDTASLQGILAGHFTPLQAYSFMVFILLYIPCLATVGVIRKETMSARWTWFSILYALIIAYAISFLIVEAGHLLGFK